MTLAPAESAPAATKTGAVAGATDTGATANCASCEEGHTKAATTPTDTIAATDAKRIDFHHGSFAARADAATGASTGKPGADTVLTGASNASRPCKRSQNATSPDALATTSPHTTADVAWCAVHHW